MTRLTLFAVTALTLGACAAESATVPSPSFARVDEPSVVFRHPTDGRFLTAGHAVLLSVSVVNAETPEDIAVQFSEDGGTSWHGMQQWETGRIVTARYRPVAQGTEVLFRSTSALAAWANTAITVRVR